MSHSWLTTDEKEKFYTSKLHPIDHLTPGYYQYDSDYQGFYLKHIELRGDQIYEVAPETRKLYQEMERFWAAANRYHELGVAYKRGILLTGPPGGGKSTITRQAIEMVVARGGFALMVDDAESLNTAMIELRKREGDAPILAVIEDVDLFQGVEETDLLEILDGTKAVNNVLFIATTNYVDKLPERIKDRPGRFDTVIPVSMPDQHTRELFVAKLLNLDPQDGKVATYANHAEVDGKSLAHLKEFVIFREIYGDELSGEGNG